MKKQSTMPALAALVVAGVVGAGIATASAALAANGIEGETTVTLDFTVAGEVDVSVYTRNLSEVPAYGSAVVTDPDGGTRSFGPRLYEAGETWTYETTLIGYTCDDLDDVSAVAVGFAAQPQTEPDWTSGQVVHPDPRVTVIGCVTATATPTPTTTVTPTPTPTATVPVATPNPHVATPTPTATVTDTPVATETPGPQAAPPTASETPATGSPAAGSPTSAVSGATVASSEETALAATGSDLGWLPLTLAAGALALGAGGHMVYVARRRARG